MFYKKDVKDENFVVIEFKELNKYFDDIYDKRTHECIELQDSIVELACVKICQGKILEHFSTFVAIDGYDAEDLIIDNDTSEDSFINAEHLIGAPSMSEVVKRVVEFAKDCVIIVRCVEGGFRKTPFEMFKDYAKSIGVEIENPIFSIGDLHLAQRVLTSIDDGKKSIFDIAKACSACFTWEEVFEEHNIFVGRNDSLSWAIAFAKLFIDFVDEEEWLPF